MHRLSDKIVDDCHLRCTWKKKSQHRERREEEEWLERKRCSKSNIPETREVRARSAMPDYQRVNTG